MDSTDVKMCLNNQVTSGRGRGAQAVPQKPVHTRTQLLNSHLSLCAAASDTEKEVWLEGGGRLPGSWHIGLMGACM